MRQDVHEDAGARQRPSAGPRALLGRLPGLSSGRSAPGGRRRGPRAGQVAVAAVLVLAGALFATSARAADGTDLRGDTTDLRSLVVQEQRTVAARDHRLSVLHRQVQQLTGQVKDPQVQAMEAGAAHLEAAAGLEAEQGAGLVVSLDDAPSGIPANADVAADTLIVHQQDLQAVVNALWAGGATAVGLQDQRIISTSAVRCVGNVLELQGRVYAPPYVVRAVGDPQALRAALDASPDVAAYLHDAERYGLGWDLQQHQEVQVPAWTGSLQLSHARVPDADATAAG